MPVGTKTSERREMRRLRHEGLHFSEIAKRMGRHRNTVMKYAGDIPCETAPIKRAVKPALRQRMRKLRAKGLTFAEIGIRVGRNASVAYTHTCDIRPDKVSVAQAKRKRRAARFEALFAACNRAVAEVRV